MSIEQTASRRADMLEQAIKQRAVELGIVEHDTHLDIFQTMQLVRDISQTKEEPPTTARERLEQEIFQLQDRLTKLTGALSTNMLIGVSLEQLRLLQQQQTQMGDLLATLKARLALWE